MLQHFPRTLHICSAIVVLAAGLLYPLSTMAEVKTVVIPLFKETGIAIGSPVNGGAPGSLLFLDKDSVLAEDRSYLNWDNVRKNMGIGTATPTNPLTVHKYSAPQWPLDSPIRGYYQLNVQSTDVPTAIIGHIINTGSNLGSTGHIIGAFGLAEDTEQGRHDMYGVEGRVNGLGSVGNLFGTLGLATWQGEDFNSRQAYGVVGRVEITSDGTTPLEEGIVSSFLAPQIIGGNLSTRYSFFGKDPMRVDNAIYAYDPETNEKYIALGNDGDLANLSANSTPLSISTLTANSIYLKPNNMTAVTINSVGNVGIGTSSPQYKLELSADSAAKPGSSAWTVPSDARIKKDIDAYTDGLNVILGINPVTYKYNGKAGFSDTETTHIGVIAQEVMKVAPYTVGTFKTKMNDRDGVETELYSFDSGALTFASINAIKELNAKLAKQQHDAEKELLITEEEFIQQKERTAELEAITAKLMEQIQALDAKLKQLEKK